MKINPLFATALAIIVTGTLLSTKQADVPTPSVDVSAMCGSVLTPEPAQCFTMPDGVSIGSTDGLAVGSTPLELPSHTLGVDYLQASGEDGDVFQPTPHSASVIQ